MKDLQEEYDYSSQYVSQMRPMAACVSTPAWTPEVPGGGRGHLL